MGGRLLPSGLPAQPAAGRHYSKGYPLYLYGKYGRLMFSKGFAPAEDAPLFVATFYDPASRRLTVVVHRRAPVGALSLYYAV